MRLPGRRGCPEARIPWLRTLPGTINDPAGERYLEVFTELGGLKPGHAVLEPGCGTGRMAKALAGFLSADGSYDGFDVVAKAIMACEKEIASRHPNFRFRHVDVRNRAYNRNGKLDPESFAFPYRDASFDFVFLTSVFTHMLPPEVEHYLGEIRRVMRPTGRALMTFFLLNADALAAIEAGRAKRTFRREGNGYRFDTRRPEEVVAYREQDALASIDAAGLALDGPIRYGRWTGRTIAPAGQDIIVVKRSE